LAIGPVTSYSWSTLRSFRTASIRKQYKRSWHPKPSLYVDPACTALYSSNPTGRKRRRRKETTGDRDDTNTFDATESAASTGDAFNMANTNAAGGITNELPDFDILDDSVSSTSTASTNTKSIESSAINPKPTVDPLVGTITPNMMASAPATNRGITDTVISVSELRDRSLEKKLESLLDGDSALTEQVKEELPDLLTLQKERKKVTTEQILLSAPSLSKKERQALARQQQDMEQQSKRAVANTQEKEDDNLFSKLPFITNESGKIEPLKLLEAATWTCIIALVLWEIYINSPFFTRAAPIIPIVYDLWI
jgi:hypothetical protein